VSHDESILRLEQELAANREYLQSIIQDLEAANEELQSANEEILSSNEELQSTNEELDTAKEELQSTNEEINTVNEELQSRNEELSRVNGDLVNLLSSVQIAIVMVASDLRIRRFTPMAEKLLNLIPTDIGRPISDIKSNLNCPELEKLITESIDTVSMKEREVQDADRNWYSLRIRPYKNLENRIDGAIVSLFEIEAAQESGQVSARELAEATLEAVHEPLALIDLDGPVVKTVNRSFREVFGGGDGDTRSTEITRPPWDRPSIRHLLEEVLPGDGRADGVPLTLGDGPDRRSFRVKARGVGPGKTRRFLLAFHEEPQDGN
jgi:two-component system CheB/CheR fusion protein